MGKSSASTTIARNVAMQGIGVLFFTLEMSKTQVAQRLLAIESGINTNKISNGTLTENELKRLSDALDRIQDVPIYIDDSSFINIFDLRAKIKKYQLLYNNIGLIIVDYIGLLTATKRGASDTETITEITRNLKGMARDNNVPILALSQLNREIDHRNPAIPILSDLRSSGSAEHDSDIVLMLYKEDEYDPETERKNIVDILIRKHRNGQTGEVSVYFDRETTRFLSLERKIYD